MQTRETRTGAGSIDPDGVDVTLALSSADGVAEQARPVALLGCSRHSAKAGYFILMREVSDKLAELSLRVQSRHMPAIDPLIAGVAPEPGACFAVTFPASQ